MSSPLGPRVRMTAAVMVILTGLAVLTAVVLALPSNGPHPVEPAAQDEPSGRACVGVRLTPEMSLQEAFEAAPDSTTFCFAAGVYRLTEPLVPKPGSVLWGKGGAVLNGSLLVRPTRFSNEGWVAPGTADSVFVDDRPLRPVTTLADLGPGRFFNDTTRRVVHLADDPAGRKVEMSVAQGAVSAFREKEQRRDNVTLRGLVIEKFTGSAAITAGWNWTIDDAEIRWNQNVGILVGSSTRVLNSRIRDNGNHGFFGYSLSDLTIEGSEIANNSWAQSVQEGAGGKVTVSDRLVFRSNKVYGNHGAGLVDWDNAHVVYDSNVLRENAGPGISQYGTLDSAIRGNTFEQNGLGFPGQSLQLVADLWVVNGKDADISGNTVTAGMNAIGIVDLDRRLTPRGQLSATNVNVHNNIIRMRDGGLTGLVGDGTSAFRSANNRFEDNEYHVTDVALSFFMWDGLRNWTEWQRQGQDATGSIHTWAPVARTTRN